MSLDVLYANSSHADGRYIKEAVQSAASFRRFLPHAQYVLYTDVNTFSDPAFDEVVTVPFTVPEPLQERRHFNGQMLVKMDAMLERDCDQVLVLGSDTYALSPSVRELPGLLDRFDIAVAHAALRVPDLMAKVPQVPTAFPEFNCDIILFRNTEVVRTALREWRQLYVTDAFEHPHDQGAFRYAMFFSDLRIATLPPEYNYRGWDVRKDTVILHRREILSQYLNGEGLPRRVARRLARRVLERTGPHQSRSGMR